MHLASRQGRQKYHGPGEQAERLENLEAEQTAHWDLEVGETIQRGRGQARPESLSAGKWGEGGVGKAVRGIKSGKQVKKFRPLGCNLTSWTPKSREKQVILGGCKSYCFTFLGLGKNSRTI